VEDHSDANKMIDIIQNSSADIYILSAIGDKDKKYLKLAEEIRTRHHNRSILFVLSEFNDLKDIINASLDPDYIFDAEVTETEIEKYLLQQQNTFQKHSLLIFTSDNQKQIVGMQSIIYAQTAGKRSLIKDKDQIYSTALTIAQLEKSLPQNFIRIDKGAIINSDYIRRFDAATETVILLSGQSFPVSRRGQKRLFDTISAMTGKGSHI
jgi:DNA-binding LytR/AlgR family response regulator